MDQGHRTRHITLTGQPPVLIDEDDWPIAARTVHVDQKEWTRRHTLIVRRHRDGRTLVYGMCATRPPGARELRAGYLLDPGADVPAVAAVLRTVAAELGAPEAAVNDALSRLPPVRI